MAIVDQQIAEGLWAYGILYDLRHTDDPTSREDAALVTAYVQAQSETHGRRGPVVLVTRAPAVLSGGLVYAYEAARRGVDIQVFWDLEEAEEWLTQRLAINEPKPEP
jgi:hypothetical protein